ncbi:hypothetical protein VTK26DRAFT_7967 [Humicola hyalothermophila]
MGKPDPVTALTKLAWKKLSDNKTNKNWDNPYKQPDRNGKKVLRPVPPYLSSNDRAILLKVRKRAYRWDMCFKLCCCSSVKFGWGSFFALLPVIGDFGDLFMALIIIRSAWGVDGGLSKRVLAWMLANVFFDFLIGLVPILGDLLDMSWRANTRNAWLLDAYLTAKSDAIGKGYIEDPDTGQKVAVPEEIRGRLRETGQPEDRDIEAGDGQEQGVVERPPATHPAMSEMRQTSAPIRNMDPPQRPVTPGRSLTPSNPRRQQTPKERPKDPRDGRRPPRR